MRCQILVPIKGRDHIEEFLPYLEDMARPDTKIVFLVHLNVDRFSELTRQLLTIQSAKPGDFSGASVAPHDPASRSRTSRAESSAPAGN